MDTETPSLADISVHYIWDWMQSFRPLRQIKQELLDEIKFPATVAVRHIRSSQDLVPFG